MDVKQWESYCEKFKTLEVVNSVYHIDMTEFDSAMNEIRKLQDPVLVCESFTVGTAGRSLDNIIDVFDCGMVILKKLSIQRSTKETKSDLLQDTFTIAKLIQKTMLADKQSSQDAFMQGFKSDSFLMEKVGPLMDQHYGWRITFEIHSPLI